VNSVANTLFAYLRDAIYNPAKATLDPDALDPDFRDLGHGLKYFVDCILETRQFAQDLSRGNLDGQLPSRGNEMAAPLKSLHAALNHLSWQTQQVAKGDYRQRVEFMGSFADAFNSMVRQLEQRRKLDTDEKFRLQELVNLMLHNCVDLVLLFDREGRLAQASDSYLRTAGIADDAPLLGKSLFQLFEEFDPAFAQSLKSLLDAALKQGGRANDEKRLDFGKDDARTYTIHVSPMLDKGGNILGGYISFHDITEIVAAQRKAEQAQKKAENAARAKSEFLAQMSHEMRTPMNAIIGMTAIGEKANDLERAKYCLNKIHEASQHLLGVINDILDMSKIDAGKLEIASTSFDLREMLRVVTDINLFNIRRRKQNFSLDINEDIPDRIISDEQRLAQIITNLLSNACKFTPEGGNISLDVSMTERREDYCRLRFVVRDSGIGVARDQQERLFLPFEQADRSTSRKYGGTGLGLPISKRLAEMLGGDIHVESELGRGASFIVDIRAGIDAADAVCAKEETVSGTTAQFPGKHMLIAEDVDINREIIAALLEDSLIEITFAEDGAQAVQAYRDAPEKFDLILMDIHMPEVDGYEATRRIRASGAPTAASIPIIAMTANVFQEDIDRCLACGMNDHLGKPVEIDKVLEKLKKYLH
jgi:PAS domain S-box-containing protein